MISAIASHFPFLRKRWQSKPRPKPLDSNYPYIALLIDSTSLEVYRPRGRFEEVKTYFDAKNCIYALKKEVAVSASPPHYALFVQKAEVGSMHDYAIFKSNYQYYLNYLMKTPEEKNLINSDAQLGNTRGSWLYWS